MKKLGFMMVLVLILGTSTSCEDTYQDVLEQPTLDPNDSGEDEDDPIPPDCEC